jgi:hypothetical protein
MARSRDAGRSGVNVSGRCGHPWRPALDMFSIHAAVRLPSRLMTLRFSLSLSLSLSLLSIACATPSGSSEATGVGDGVDDSASDTGDSDTGDSDTGGTSSAACEALIACIEIVSPEAITSTIVAYGSDGTCFDLPGVTPEDCALECDALRANLAMINPDVAECAAPDCNDGVLGLEELCDSTPGCSATCTFSSGGEVECNLLNQTGCEDDESCWLSITGEVVVCHNQTVWMPGSNVGDSCSELGSACEDFSVCTNHPTCGGAPCCLATCYLGATENDFGACAAGEECLSFADGYGPSLAEGAELYGACI